MPSESALVALIPAAEALVEPFRRRFDPSAAVGVPAHVTILYPFKTPEALTPADYAALQALFAAEPGFAVVFAETRRFPDVLYLAPEPAEPFRRLTAQVAGRHPETPPYRGAFAEVIPHLTIAQPAEAAQVDEIAAAFQAAAQGRLPIRQPVAAITLIDNAAGRWQTRAHFALGRA